MSLVTRCPKCASEYDVTADQLKLHDGLVRCGECSHVFDGFASLVESLPTLTRKASESDAPAPKQAPVTPVASAPSQNASPNPSHALVREDVASSPAPPPPPPPKPAPKPAPSDSNEPSFYGSQPMAPVVNDGPFIPSVDRLASVARQAQSDSRQEPAFGISTPPVQSTSEPSLGKLLQASDARASQDREPVLGAMGATQPELSTPQPAPVRVVGEARLRGEDPSATGRTVPEFLEEEDEPEPEGRSLLWLVGSIVLAVVLLIQAMVVYRNDIVASAPSLRPLLVTLCQPFGCDVSHVRQINRIFIVGSSLQQAPTTQGPLDQRDYVLRLTLQNRAAYPQPWPSLMLTLRDASGTPVVRKAFLPSEYLQPALLAGPMRARQEANVELELTVDGVNVSGYELDRFFP